MKMFYDDFEVGDTIGYDENWDGRLTGRMIEHVLTEISLKDIKTWETKDNPHNMRIIKKGTNKTTQQIIDEDFEGGLTMGQIQCKDCNDNLTDCTCIEDTIDMKQTPGKETADYIDRHVVEAMVEVAKQKMYSEEEVIDIAKQAFVLGKDFGLIGTFSEWFEQFRKK
jgi:hypothetical protein